jgi:hypothetical protein
VTTLVLDCGALIALERSDRRLWLDLRLVAEREGDVVVPSTALAQAWRGGSSQALLARALDHCVIAPFDPLARAAGELCGRSRTSDVCDAHVALVAASADVLYTSDPKDLERLLAALGRGRPKVLRC